MEKLEQLDRIRDEGVADVAGAPDQKGLESARVKHLGRKSALMLLLRELGGMEPAERSAVGKRANEVKKELAAAVEARTETLATEARQAALAGDDFDLTLPGERMHTGHIHPVSQAARDIVETFKGMGFEVADGPEIENEYYNFEALNIPAFHPARDMQDTFFLDGGLLLRTHTSNVQIRTMETRKPPLAILAPGKVYRRDSDVTHSPMFHQIEGFMVGEGITFGNLKSVLTSFIRAIFGKDRKVRFRPSFFPFVEPGAEMDVECVICNGAGGDCRVCKGTAWLEILGSGMIHPKVFEAVGYDTSKYSGFAFGLGIDRVAMLRHGIPNIRLLFDNDLRFLQQF